VTGYIPRWFTRTQMVTHPSTNPAMHSQESNSQPVDVSCQWEGWFQSPQVQNLSTNRFVTQIYETLPGPTHVPNMVNTGLRAWAVCHFIGSPFSVIFARCPSRTTGPIVTLNVSKRMVSAKECLLGSKF